MKKTFFQRDWGFLHGEVSRYHFDFFPRLTAVTTPHILEVSAGFLCFRIWLTVFSQELQEVERRNRTESGQ